MHTIVSSLRDAVRPLRCPAITLRSWLATFVFSLTGYALPAVALACCGNGCVTARHPIMWGRRTYGGAPYGRSAAGSQVRQPCTAVGAAMGRTGMTIVLCRPPIVLRRPPMVLRKPPIVLHRPPMVLRRPPIIMGRNRRNRRTKRTFHTNPVGLKVRRCILSSPLYFQSTPWVAHNGKKQPRLHDGSHGRFCYYWNWCQGRGRYQLSVFRKKL